MADSVDRPAAIERAISRNFATIIRVRAEPDLNCGM
jgi:hypothetical protein